MWHFPKYVQLIWCFKKNNMYALPFGFDAAAELLYEKWPWLMEDLKPCHLFVSLILFVWLVV